MKKFVVSFFSALLLAFSFISVLPVSADYPAETAETIREYYSDALAVHRDEAVKILKDKFSSEGYDLSNYHYIIVESYRNQWVAEYNLFCLNFSSLKFTDFSFLLLLLLLFLLFLPGIIGIILSLIILVFLLVLLLLDIIFIIFLIR